LFVSFQVILGESAGTSTTGYGPSHLGANLPLLTFSFTITLSPTFNSYIFTFW